MNIKDQCQRCLIGIDDDHDGDCAICAHMTDNKVAAIRHRVREFEKAIREDENKPCIGGSY